MKTVRKLINELEDWIKSGYLDEDSPVVYATDSVAVTESPVFNIHIVGCCQPIFDPKNPTKTACYLAPTFDRIETDYDIAEKETRYKYRKQKK